MAVPRVDTVPALSFIDVTKTFGSLTANDGVTFEVADRSIHGVVGENGAGKSTILKIAYGLYQADRGRIEVRGQKVAFRSPEEAIEKGIGMVHQHFMLVPTLTVWQNVILGKEPFAWKNNRKAALEILSKLQAESGFNLDLNARVGDLSVGLQQQVEILKLLYRRADILIFDEPTAVLTPQEVTALMERLRQLRNQGKTVVFISHKLKEVLAITDRVTVLRQGKVVGSASTRDLNEESLAQWIIGTKIQPLPKRKVFDQTQAEIRVKDLEVRQGTRAVLKQVSFQVNQGEIVGIAGIEGNGQQELIEVLAKVRTDYSGKVVWRERDYRLDSAYEMKQAGLAVLPADRHQEAVVLDFDLNENALLGHHREPDVCRFGRLLWNKVTEKTRHLIKRFDVRPPDPFARMGGLSGGNQQKMVVGRELSRPVRFLLAAHPTRGVDIGATLRIHAEVLRLRDEGAAVLLVSSELDEILALADRILVLYNGAVQGECLRAQASETQLGLWMTGG